ncbi:MAG: N-acetylmuramoyl-L-alanine amidase [Alphaproteobacteria bacterium]
MGTANVASFRPRALAAGWLVAILLGLLAAPAAAEKPLVIKATDAGVLAGEATADGNTRFVLDLADVVDVTYFTLTDHYRLVLDLPELDWQVPWGTAFSGDGLIEAVRYARNKPGHSRIVLDLTGPAKVDDDIWYKLPGGGHRLVLDLETTDPQVFAKNAGWPERSDVSRPGNQEKVLVQKRQGRHVIAIDPGHGGYDPGAVGSGGLYEKDVALKMALQLKKTLEARGKYDVHLTRKSDRFVSHEDRVAFAREREADLFISLHADANEVRSVNGVSIYTLDERPSDGVVRRLVEKENEAKGRGAREITDDVLKILIDLTQRDTMTNSARFARLMLPKLRARKIDLAPKPHRGGPFYVLTAADVPSVLIEMGFMSNAHDRRLLSSGEWRASLAEGLADAMELYFTGHTAMMPLQPGG